MRFYAARGNEARLTALLERGVVTTEDKDEYTMVFNAPAQVTLAGHGGAQAELMGLYELTGEVVHDGPLYVKSRGTKGYLFRNNNPEPDRIGKWMVTNSRDGGNGADGNAGYFLSAEAAGLPSQPGLIWQCGVGGWHDEPGITCTSLVRPKL